MYLCHSKHLFSTFHIYQYCKLGMYSGGIFVAIHAAYNIFPSFIYHCLGYFRNMQLFPEFQMENKPLIPNIFFYAHISLALSLSLFYLHLLSHALHCHSIMKLAVWNQFVTVLFVWLNSTKPYDRFTARCGNKTKLCARNNIIL